MAGEGGGVSGGSPRLFGEHILRMHLSNMYAAMVASTGNARLLLDRDPAGIRREDAEGGAVAKDQLDGACGWLDEARIVCEPAAFDAAILGCARRAAAYLVAVRDAGESTGRFDSWVFRKSAPLDDGGGGGEAGRRAVVSAIVPALETCMSVRMPPEVAEGVSRGPCRIGPATPMPLTNRLHCVRGAEAAPLPADAPGLAGWDFLKASASDLDALSDSIEMDGYCEVAPVQDDTARPRLGAPVILPGSVERLDDSSVTIRGLSGEDVFAVRQGGSPPEPDGLPNGAAAGRAAGMHGRFLLVAWYRPGLRVGAGGASGALAPELLHYEACGRGEAELDDLIGYVRMRGRASAAELLARYGKDHRSIASGAACLAAGADGAVKYRRAREIGAAGGGPDREFFGAVDDMRAAWSRFRAGGGLPASPGDIVSEEGADAEALSAWMAHGVSANRELLADLQDEFDRTGHWRGELDAASGGGAAAGRGGVSHRAACLERLGLLARDGRILRVTDRGQRALAGSYRRDAGRYLSGKACLYLPEAESRIPASVLLRRLRDGGDFERAEGPHGRDALLWVRKGADAAADLARCVPLLEGHRRLALDCARTANHEVNARFVRGEMERRGERIACLHASLILERLAHAGRLVAAGGGSWRYPLRGRILDTMRVDRARAWDMDGILKAAGAGRNVAKDAGGALEGLAADGLIVGLEDGRWACRIEGGDEAGQRRRRAEFLARKAAVSILRQRGTGMDSVSLAERVSGYLSVQFQANRVRGLRQIARDAISGLVEDGSIREGDGMLRPAA